MSNIFSTEQLFAQVGQVMALNMAALQLLDQVLSEQEAILIQKKAAK